MIKVSVVIPVYNVESYLTECLNSVVNQTLEEIEIICVDDASTDQSLEILKDFQKKDQRIVVKEISKNSGLPYVRNRGLELASGKYVYFLDSDDMIEQNTLDELFAEAEKKETDVLFFDGWVKYENDSLGESFRGYQIKRRYEYKEVRAGMELFCDFVRNQEWTPSVPRQFWRREFLNTNGIKFYEGIIHEDELFSFVAVLQSKKAGYIKKQYFCRRFRENSIMTNKVSANNFYGYFTAYYFMNKFAYQNGYCMEEVRSYIARIYGVMQRTYQKLKDNYDLSEGLQNEELKNAFYVFCSMQDAYMDYGNINCTVLQHIMQYKEVYIYGAGVIGKSVYEGIVRKGIGVSGFVVTNKGNTPNYINGHPVFELEQLECDKEESIFVVAVKDVDQGSVVERLNNKGYFFTRYNERCN